MKRAEVIDVLNGIIKKKRVQGCPRASQMNRKKERQTCSSALSTTKDELRVQSIAAPQTQESANVAADAVVDRSPVGVRAQTLI
jgi:hypothetical protein